VQFVETFGDDHALDVLPRTLADAVVRVDRRLAIGRLGAEIGVPAMAAGTDGLGQALTDSVGSSQATEIGTLAGAGAGHKEGHIGLLRRGAGTRTEHHRCC